MNKISYSSEIIHDHHGKLRNAKIVMKKEKAMLTHSLYMAHRRIEKKKLSL